MKFIMDYGKFPFFVRIFGRTPVSFKEFIGLTTKFKKMKKNYANLLAFLVLVNFVFGLTAQNSIKLSPYHSQIEQYLEENKTNYGLKQTSWLSLLLHNKRPRN